MRVLVIVKATAATEAGALPTQAQFTAMGLFNEQLVEAGIMLAGEGLHPTGRARRVQFGGDVAPNVVDGPFMPETQQAAGFWLWQVRSLDEATEWLVRAPFLAGDVVEIRPIMEAEDLGETFTAALREQEERLARQLASR